MASKWHWSCLEIDLSRSVLPCDQDLLYVGALCMSSGVGVDLGPQSTVGPLETSRKQVLSPPVLVASRSIAHLLWEGRCHQWASVGENLLQLSATAPLALFLRLHPVFCKCFTTLRPLWRWYLGWWGAAVEEGIAETMFISKSSGGHSALSR